MKSPFTGGEVKITRKPEDLEFRGERFTVIYNSYKCIDTGQEFTTSTLDDLNLQQLHNKYRAKHKIPFPEDIFAIRDKYNVSQNKMALILGFGQNTYRKYEHGDIPSLSNAKLINMADDPTKFLNLVEDCEELKASEKEKITNTAEQLVKDKSLIKWGVYNWLFGENIKPNQFNGYRKPSLKKFNNMIKYFAATIEPHKTKLNKLLFYSDYCHYQKFGRSISGINYQAIQMGPVPHRYDTLFEIGVDEEDFFIEYKEYENRDHIGEKFKAKDSNIDQDYINDDELHTLKFIKEKLGNISTQELIKMSHEEDAWLENKDVNGIINYELAFNLKHLN